MTDSSRMAPSRMAPSLMALGWDDAWAALAAPLLAAAELAENGRLARVTSTTRGFYSVALGDEDRMASLPGRVRRGEAGISDAARLSVM